jgi:hypothetical protein
MSACSVAVLWLIAASAACGASAGNPSPQPPQDVTAPVTADAITEISLERRCFGCEPQFKIAFARDGRATRTTFGSARQRVQDRHAEGSIGAAAFSELARLVVSEGFWQLRDEYRDPQTADGAWAVTTVAAAGRQKSVMDRHAMAPAALQRIQRRIEEVAASVTWKSSASQGS